MKEPESKNISEEFFHDAWASSVEVSDIDVAMMNESCTAPEMRYIRGALGDLRDKTVLDLGCGFGEAGLYFALSGAKVTAVDISQNMLEAATRLAQKYNLKIKTHKASSQALGLNSQEKFDIIYAGNLFHHVDIEASLRSILPYTHDDSILVSWDPVAYNPLINIYRAITTKTRTPGEHPIRLKDIKLFKKYFRKVRCRWFWLTTLLIFVIFVLFQGRNPNKIRYWKVIVEEGERWKWLYQPLEALDNFLLAVFFFLRPLCWNVVIISSQPDLSAAG